MFKVIDINENTESFKSCIQSIKNINNNKLKNKFTLQSKYSNTFDLRHENHICAIYQYDNAFLNILHEHNIFNEIEKMTKKKVYLYHIQYRNVLGSKYSYQAWHRDTHYLGNEKISGNTPPIYKVIFYPKINNIVEPCLNIVPNSHLRYKNEGKYFKDYNPEDLYKNYTDYNEKVIDIYPDNKLLIFNTSLYHNACMSNKNNLQTRIIYSFTTDIDRVNNILEKKQKFDCELVKTNFN